MSPGGRVLIDTSAWIDALRPDGDPGIRAQVRTLTMEAEAVLCDMVLLELWNGARGTEEAAALSDLEQNLDRVPTPPEVWQAAYEMARSCGRKGLTIPATDLLIAACAEQHGLSILHRDAHFEQIAQIVGRQEPS